MKSFSGIIDKIKLLKNIKKDGDVAHLLGLDVKNFSSYKTRNVVPADVLIDFCEHENISLNWLFFDIGDPELALAEDNSGIAALKKDFERALKETQAKFDGLFEEAKRQAEKNMQFPKPKLK